LSKRVRDYTYEELLDRAYSKLPSKSGSTGVVNIPKAEIIYVGGKTILTNFKQIIEFLNREGELLQLYLSKELGTASYIDDAGQLVLQGRFNVQVLNKLIEIFTKNYVLCPTCGSKDTKLLRKGKVFILKCEACGAETSFKSF